jgi:diguanylate cyclase (GGDEF)-like protein
VFRQTIALRVIAEIHAKHPLPVPPDIVAPSVPLHYLLRALELSSHIENYTIPGTLLEELAHEYAQVGDMAKAYELAMRARQSDETIRSANASKLAIAMQVQHESEKARVEADKAQAEAERQRQLARTEAERALVLEQANHTLEQLVYIGLEITGNLDTDAVFAALDRHVHALLDAPSFAIFRLDPDARTLTMVFGMEAGRPLPPCRVDTDDDTSLAARCMRERREFVIQRPSHNAHPVVGTLDTQSVMFAPLVAGGRPLGVMTMQSTRPNAYAEREVAIFRTLCAYGAVALVNADAQSHLMGRNRHLELLSTRDRLTDLGNRLHLDQTLAHELQRSRRTQSSLSVIMLDIDHFKSVNDRHGHLAGDQVLVCVARLLLEGARELDLVGRWGGEEFVVVCRDTDLGGAAVLAEKLRSRIAANPLPFAGRTTCSFGVACLRDGESVDDLMARADTAMYTAKQAGRNRVSVASADT